MTPGGYHRILINPFPPQEVPVFNFAQRVLKALAAAGSAAVATYGMAVTDGVTGAEWVKVLLAAVGAYWVVWAVPKNKEKVPAP